MAVLKNITKTLKVAGQGAAKVSSGMMNVAGSIGNTAGKIANFITGGKREQSYGYTSEYFPMREKKYKSDSKVTQIRPKAIPLTPIPAFSNEAANSQLANIFNFMKRMHEQNMTRLEVQNSFSEERQNEEANRHKELLNAIQKFTDTKTTTLVTETKKEGTGGLLDMFKNMLESAVKNVLSVINGLINGVKKSLDWLSDLKLASRFLPDLAKFLVSPWGIAFLAATSIGAFLKLIADQKKAIEENPNAPEYRDNPYAMMLRGETKSVAQAGEANIRRTVKSFNRPEIEQAAKSELPDEVLVDAYGRDKINLQKWLSDNPTQMKYQAPVAPIVGLPRTGAEAGEVARTMATPLPPEVKPSDAGAGRGSSEATSVDTRRLDLPKAEPIPPAPSPVSSLTMENKDLEDQVTVSSTVTEPIVSVNGSSEVVNTPPIPSTATWRDDEPMVDRVLQKTRAYV